MLRIDTTVEARTIEIDDKEYKIAPRTIDVCEKLLEVGKANLGKPTYRLKLAEMRILLGDEAYRELFRLKEHENVDRIDIIYKAVSRAFSQTEDELDASDAERKAQAMASALAPLNELMRNLRAVQDKPTGVKEIRRR